MQVNVFEGARRILYLIMLAVGGVGLWIISEAGQRLERNYDVVIDREGDVSYQMIPECRSDDATRYYSANLPTGEAIWGSLCFRTFLSTRGERVVLNDVGQDGTLWGSPSYSSETTALQNRAESSFAVPAADLPRLQEDAQNELWRSRRESFGYLAMTLGGLWLAGALLGWIARGFLGIPSGRDSRLPT